MNKCFLACLYALALPAQASCYIAASPLDFGMYDPSSSTATTSMADIDINCDSISNLTLELSGGLNSVNQQRRMSHEARSNEFLNYSLTQDAAHTRSWGLASQGTALTTSTTSKQHLNIYGVIPAGQQPWVGYYRDQVTLTLLP